MPDITKDKYDFAKVLKTDRDGARVDVVGLPRECLFHGKIYLKLNRYGLNQEIMY